MSQPALSFFSRLVLAWRILTDASLAAQAATPALADRAPAQPKPEEKTESLAENSTTGALQLLGMLQQHGRLIDFLQEDVSAFSDTALKTVSAVPKFSFSLRAAAAAACFRATLNNAFDISLAIRSSRDLMAILFISSSNSRL